MIAWSVFCLATAGVVLSIRALASVTDWDATTWVFIIGSCLTSLTTAIVAIIRATKSDTKADANTVAIRHVDTKLSQTQENMVTQGATVWYRGDQSSTGTPTPPTPPPTGPKQ